MRKGLYILLVLLAGADRVRAQSAEVQPPELRRIPVAGVGEGRYWQQLVVTLGQDDAEGDSTLTVHLPPALKLLDTSGNGRVDDEVRVVYVSAGSEAPDFYVSSELTTDQRIVLGSRQQAGAGAKVYLQYPVTVNATLEVLGVGYGPVSFGDERELDLEIGPDLSYVFEEAFVAQGSMQLVELGPAFNAGADTSTSAVGTYYPEAPETLTLKLPDLVFDGGVSTSSALLGQGNGDDGDDVGYRFYFSTEEQLESIAPDVAQEARRADETIYAEREGKGSAVQLLTRDLPEGRYFLYVTADVVGGLVLGKSRALQVRHAPRVDQVGSVDGTTELDSGILQDNEGRVLGQGPHQVELEFSVTDNDEVPAVQLYYSEADGLGALDMVLTDGAVSGLDRAVAITAEGGLQRREGSVQWDILTPQVVPAGSYYIYAVASDGRNHTLGRSQAPIQVRHAPYLRLDPLDDAGPTTIATGGVRPQRYLTFTWGRSGSDGDQDVDDNAFIDLYYSTTPAQTASAAGFAIPGGATELLADLGFNTQAIATGIAEDPDQRQDNQYTWDLRALAGEGRPVPKAGPVYYLYGIIDDGVSKRLAQANGGRLNDAGARLIFAHAPTLRPLQPLAETSVRPGRSGRVSWEDMDLDNNARIRVVLSPEDQGEVSDYAAVYSGSALVANSATGQPPAAVDPVFDLNEDSGVDYYDLTTANFPIPAGLYYVYLAAADEDRFGAGSRAWRTPGQVRVEEGGEPAVEVFRLFPQVFSIGAGQRQAFELRVDAAGQLADLVLATLKVDTGTFAVVDQDESLPGIQPFAVVGAFSPAQLIGNQLSVQIGGSSLLSLAYFDPIGGVAGLDGRRSLVRLELESLKEGQVQVELVADGGGGWVSRLEKDGKPVLSPADQTVAEGTVVPGRAVVHGQLLLEGRPQGNARVSCTLRPWGQYEPLVDTVFAAANDADTAQAGVQVDLKTDGAFELKQVLAGRLDLHFHFAGYLDAWAPGLDLHPGQTLDGVRPFTPGAESLMLGGDVAGYLELDGASRPDNEVTLADWDFAAAFYGADLSGEEGRADITGDGQVDIRDLSLIGGNFLGRGPQPVYKAGGAPQLVQLALRLATPVTEAGQEVVLVVEGAGLEAVHAAQVEVRLPAGQWEWIDPPAPVDGALVAYHREGERILVGVSRQGHQGGFGPVLLEGRLRSLQAQPEMPALGEILLLDAAHRALSLQGGEVLPGEYTLLQNYPNPFNPETTIEFTLPSRGTARLEIFDALGQRVARLWDGPLRAGSHRLQWDGRDERGRLLGSGVYFYRLHSGELDRVRRMVLLR